MREGPECDTGQNMLPGTEPSPEDEKIIGRAPFKADLIDPFGRPSDVASFSDPSYGFRKRKDGKVEVIFLPWHRRNGHSITMGAFFAALVYILTSLLNTPVPPYVWAMAVFFPWLLHVIIDQFGHMGNNLFWPFTRHRNSGLGLVSASDPYWNFFVVYSSVALIFWNMNHAARSWLSAEAVAWSGVSLWYYALLVIVILLAIIGGLTLIYKTYFEGKGEGEPPVKSAAARIIEELPEDQQMEIEERPVPPLLIRLMGPIILAGILLFFIQFGWSL